MVPWDPPGVPRVPILGPNRGMFSKLNWPGPLGSGGHSHTIFSNGRFQGAQRSFGGDVREKQMSIKRNYFAETFSQPLNEIFLVILSGGNSHPES